MAGLTAAMRQIGKNDKNFALPAATECTVDFDEEATVAALEDPDLVRHMDQARIQFRDAWIRAEQTLPSRADLVAQFAAAGCQATSALAQLHRQQAIVHSAAAILRSRVAQAVSLQKESKCRLVPNRVDDGPRAYEGNVNAMPHTASPAARRWWHTGPPVAPPVTPPVVPPVAPHGPESTLPGPGFSLPPFHAPHACHVPTPDEGLTALAAHVATAVAELDEAVGALKGASAELGRAHRAYEAVIDGLGRRSERYDQLLDNMKLGGPGAEPPRTG